MFNNLSGDVRRVLYIKAFDEIAWSELEQIVYFYVKRIDEDIQLGKPDRSIAEVMQIVRGQVPLKHSAGTLASIFDQADTRVGNWICKAIAVALKPRLSSDDSEMFARELWEKFSQDEANISNDYWEMVDAALRRHLALDPG